MESGLTVDWGCLYDNSMHISQFKERIFPHKAGFTLVELLVVISIIGILATITVLTFSGSQTKARDAKRKADIHAIQSALELYIGDHNRYTVNLSSFDANDIQTVPTDPRTKNSYSYITDAAGDCYILYAVLENVTDPQGKVGGTAVSSGSCAVTLPLPSTIGYFAVTNP